MAKTRRSVALAICLAFLALTGCGSRARLAVPRLEPVKVRKMPTATSPGESPGATLYRQRCAQCHGMNGEGVAGVYPGLWGAGSTLFSLPLPGGFGKATDPVALARYLQARMPPGGPVLGAAEAAELAEFLAGMEVSANPQTKIGGNTCG